MTFRTKFLLFVSICVPPNNPKTACGATSFPGYHSFPKWAMAQHFPIKSGQPIEMALVILNFVAKFPNKGKEPVCQKWNGEFRSEYSDRSVWTTSRGDSEYSGQKKPK